MQLLKDMKVTIKRNTNRKNRQPEGENAAGLSKELCQVAAELGLPPEQLARLVLAAFVAGLDGEEPTVELPLRLVQARQVNGEKRRA